MSLIEQNTHIHTHTQCRLKPSALANVFDRFDRPTPRGSLLSCCSHRLRNMRRLALPPTRALCVFTGDHQEGPGEPRLWLQRVRRAPGEGRLRQHDPPARPRRAGRPQTIRSHPAGTIGVYYFGPGGGRKKNCHVRK